MSNVEKFTSNKATVETRYNETQGRYRAHITSGKRRVGPVFVRLPGGDGEAADAARVALERAAKRKEIDLDDLEHDDDGAIVVQAEGAKGNKAPMRAKPPAAKAKPARKPEAKTSMGQMRKAPVEQKSKPKAEAKTQAAKAKAAMPALPNGELTRELETQYRSAKKQYHIVGDALRERHEAETALAADAP